MKENWKFRCVICGKFWGHPNGKLLQTFCKECQRKVRNPDVLKDYLIGKERKK